MKTIFFFSWASESGAKAKVRASAIRIKRESRRFIGFLRVCGVAGVVFYPRGGGLLSEPVCGAAVPAAQQRQAGRPHHNHPNHANTASSPDRRRTENVLALSGAGVNPLIAAAVWNGAATSTTLLNVL